MHFIYRKKCKLLQNKLVTIRKNHERRWRMVMTLIIYFDPMYYFYEIIMLFEGIFLLIGCGGLGVILKKKPKFCNGIV